MSTVLYKQLWFIREKTIGEEPEQETLLQNTFFLVPVFGLRTHGATVMTEFSFRVAFTMRNPLLDAGV